MVSAVVDTHCHLDLLQEQGLEILPAIQNAKRHGIQNIVQIGIDETSSQRALEIAEQFSNGVEIYFTIGCHPCNEVQDAEIERIFTLAENLKKHPKFVGIGEIGLDYYHLQERERQKNVFRKFIELSIALGAPIIVHSRDAAEDTYQILSEYKNQVFGTIHCFTYNLEYAQKFIDLGFYISFSGILTFKSAKDIQEAAASIPLENILVETDSPYLAPVPHRGKRNEPAYTSYVLKYLFHLRKESKQKVEEQIFQNSKNFIQRKRALC